MSNQVRPTLVVLAAMSILLGIGYPLAITGVAQLLFPHRANGSLIPDGDQIRGSELIGQPFSEPRSFWGRLSATAPPCNASASSGANLGPLNPALLDAVKTRIAALHEMDPDQADPIPVDLVTASASGLDPHISMAAARYQCGRVARARGRSIEAVEALIEQNTEPRQFGLLGEPRVNVLQLNLALDGRSPPR